MSKTIKIEEIYEQNLNFIIGSGASVGIAPTLKINAVNLLGETLTIETLATLFDKENKPELLFLTFAHYYYNCVRPIANLGKNEYSDTEKNTLGNYVDFIDTIIKILNRKENFKKRCNIFTTNYDSAFEIAAEKMLSHGGRHFSLNDGSSGFKNKYLNSKNFNTFSYQTGIFDGHISDIPQINLIHLHGSIYWSKDDEKIKVDYTQDITSSFNDESLSAITSDFTGMLMDESEVSETEILEATFDVQNPDVFWESYNNLPIINPTKNKFHQTVFDEHYYQMLRLMSYELEKPDSVFISFGFSFADEHIRNLVIRSLSNPRLKLFVCCFNNEEREVMNGFFQGFNNVELISLDEDLDFTRFNEDVFTLKQGNEI